VHFRATVHVRLREGLAPVGGDPDMWWGVACGPRSRLGRSAAGVLSTDRWWTVSNTGRVADPRAGVAVSPRSCSGSGTRFFYGHDLRGVSCCGAVCSPSPSWWAVGTSSPGRAPAADLPAPAPVMGAPTAPSWGMEYDMRLIVTVRPTEADLIVRSGVLALGRDGGRNRPRPRQLRSVAWSRQCRSTRAAPRPRRETTSAPSPPRAGARGG
jgi:hypothetical protein